MIDTHCHLLHGLDDGPSTEAESTALAGRLAVDGVSFVLCTPHYSRAFPTSHADASRRLDALRAALTASDITLDVGLAAEVAPGYAVSEPIEELVLRSVGGRYVIVEVLSGSPPGLFRAVADYLGPADLVPVFAHPERCRAVRRHPSLLAEARERGALVQIVAPSLLGRWGRAVASVAWGLVGAGWVDLLGSDAHGPERRGVHLAEAAARVAHRVGPGAAVELTERRPALVIGGLDLGRTAGSPY